MPFVAGGELFHHLHKQGLLLESSAKFYAAEMVLALEHLHSKGIIHRYEMHCYTARSSELYVIGAG